MPFQVRYKDDVTGYEWTANFATEEEARAQAEADNAAYGGEVAQEVLDEGGNPLPLE